MPAARGTSLTTTMRVIDRVHDHTANGRPNAAPAAGAGLAELAQVVFRVAAATQCARQSECTFAHLTRTQAQGGIVAIARNELHRRTCTTRHLGTFSDLQLDAVHRAADRDVAQGMGVSDSIGASTPDLTLSPDFSPSAAMYTDARHQHT